MPDFQTTTHFPPQFCRNAPTFAERLETALKGLSSNATHRQDNSEITSCNDDLEVLRKTGQKTSRLLVLYNQLNGIPLTTVEAERAFSTAGNLCTRIRSRLSDSLRDALAFLRGNSTWFQKL